MTQTLDRPQVEDVPQGADEMGRVLRGAAFLDTVEQAGWERRIDLGKLDIISGCNCILGQLCGVFSKAYKKYHMWSSDDVADHALSHGFAARSAHEARALESCWREVLQQRKETI